jgi:hypothetical protein
MRVATAAAVSLRVATAVAVSMRVGAAVVSLRVAMEAKEFIG